MASSTITRFPPSPTGPLHIGNVRTALFNYLFARKMGGEIILRFEDTDRKRSKREYEDHAYESLEWLGLTFDHIYRQSERTLIYRKYLEKMIEEGTAYVSKEADLEFEDAGGEDQDEESERERRDEVIRLKNPNKKVVFEDLVRGEIEVDTTELGDFVIAKSLEEPLYHFAVVTDDFEMGITHVIRGEDGIYNTPRQILIQEAIGAPRPIYCHIPFVFGPDKKKFSKRHGAISVLDYRDEGILPEALLNYLALLGWNPGTPQEIFTPEELIAAFDLGKVQKAGAVFDPEKLRWINQEHIKRMDEATFKKHAYAVLASRIAANPHWNEQRFDKLVPELKNRITVFKDLDLMWEGGEFDYLFALPSYDAKLLVPTPKDGKPPTLKKVTKHLHFVSDLLEKLEEASFTKEGVKEALAAYAEKEGRGNVLWPLRVALSGRERSPDPYTLCDILGKTEVLRRLQEALTLLKADTPKKED
ncbi:MAG TPA: glutamate--tRNA ligase [Candidatus Paceibacterota bacterium]|nr:glutamate--tRNA ligase [Candidatus Paceibacterota bacterium]